MQIRYSQKSTSRKGSTPRKTLGNPKTPLLTCEKALQHQCCTKSFQLRQALSKSQNTVTHLKATLTLLGRELKLCKDKLWAKQKGSKQDIVTILQRQLLLIRKELQPIKTTRKSDLGKQDKEIQRTKTIWVGSNKQLDKELHVKPESVVEYFFRRVALGLKNNEVVPEALLKQLPNTVSPAQFKDKLAEVGCKFALNEVQAVFRATGNEQRMEIAEIKRQLEVFQDEFDSDISSDISSP